MTKLSWLRHKLVLGSFYSHQQLMNNMVKIPRQFETILDVGLQRLCPWTLLGVFTACSQAPSCIPWISHYVHEKSLGNITTFIPPPKVKSQIILYIFDSKLFLWAYIFYLFQVKSSNKRKIKHTDILKKIEIF